LSYKVVAVYDDSSATIYLAHGWTGDTRAGPLVIVHEMVPHLQHEARTYVSRMRSRRRNVG